MNYLVVGYSFTGNNRLLAETLAERLNAELIEVEECHRRSGLTTLVDMLFRRTPKIHPLRVALADYDHIVLVAPVWNAQVAHPMQAFVKQERDHLSSYSFLTLCGYERPHQQQRLRAQLEQLAGHPPKTVQQLKVCELVPEGQRKKISVVSSYRVVEEELAHFQGEIRAFLAAIEA